MAQGDTEGLALFYIVKEALFRGEAVFVLPDGGNVPDIQQEITVFQGSSLEDVVDSASFTVIFTENILSSQSSGICLLCRGDLNGIIQRHLPGEVCHSAGDSRAFSGACCVLI